MMENSLVSVPIDIAGRNSVAIDGIASQTTPNSLVQFDSFGLDSQSRTFSGYAVLSSLQEPINSIQADIQIANEAAVANLDALRTPLGRSAVRGASPGRSHPIANTECQDQFVGGMPISDTALVTLLAARSGLQENLNNLAISGPSIFPSGVLRSYASSDPSTALNSFFASPANHGCDELFGNINGKGDHDKFPAPVEVGGKTPIRVAFQSYSSTENLQPNCWMTSHGMNVSANNPYGSCKFSNELSLSLATSQPSVINGTSVPDQCSEIRCSSVVHDCLKETILVSEQTSCSTKELSLSCGSSRAGQFSQVISGSRYLHVTQEILSQIARYSLENLDQISFSTSGIKGGGSASFSSSYPTEGRTQLVGFNDSPNMDSQLEIQMDPALQKRAMEAKRTQLLTLLRVVDERYSQCLDEIHTVISAFHAATELDPQVHARFALQAVSFLYKNLRERISNQILAMGAHFGGGCMIETEGSFEASYFQKHWTLQQLKKKDHQLWRPQRGLPERSVSVLRTWMFQNFLHPYPKDADKHLLAVKSGLTRSQVSNWFINARVRLWKPMIEEMYAEMNKRQSRQNEEGTNSSHRSHISISNPRFNVN